ncbi:MAG TPA: DUF2267 domain-containing protein [Dehalococcoidia bacterium]|nr:DUF2267 domain-containing protein [Dehalococcoidia bacterium]
MSATGLGVFDTTVQKTMTWLKDIMDELHWEDRHRAYLALRGCLHLLRDRLSVEEVAHLGAQLPMLVRGIYYEGWDPTHNPSRERTAAEFAGGLIDYFPQEGRQDYERIMSGCLHVMSRHVDPGITRHVRGVMPHSIADLWQEERV